MVFKRIIPLLAIMLTLAGCFRQADEPFESVDSQNVAQSIPQTSTVTIIDPNATDVPASTVQSQVVEPTETVIVINPTLEEPTATEAIILPATSTPLTIPTATEASFITPEAPVEVLVPTATEEDVEEPTLEPTPTAEGDEGDETDTTTSDSECSYVIQSGDNLFRIAINNGVSLNALLKENDLSEASIIQPNQIIIIPGCDEDGSTTAVEEEPTEDVATEEPSDECIYEVESGDTLYDIAIELDVSLRDLLAENELSELSIIQPGQVLEIPDCVDANGNSTSSSSSSSSTDAEATEAVSTVTIHTVTGEDTLLSIAQLYGVTVNDIIQNNSIPDPNNLSVGQQLLIPELES